MATSGPGRWPTHPTRQEQVNWTVVVLVSPFVPLLVLVLLGANGDLGTVELLGILAWWAVGLMLVWVVPLALHLVGRSPAGSTGSGEQERRTD
jgi:hypothetical protein